MSKAPCWSRRRTMYIDNRSLRRAALGDPIAVVADGGRVVAVGWPDEPAVLEAADLLSLPSPELAAPVGVPRVVVDRAKGRRDDQGAVFRRARQVTFARELTPQVREHALV